MCSKLSYVLKLFQSLMLT